MAFLEIDKNILNTNIHLIKRAIASSVKIMAVVKANAYGLGAIEIARHFDQNKTIDYLAVGRLEEGIELKVNEVKKPIIVFANLLVDDINTYISYDLEATVSDMTTLNYLIGYRGTQLKIHLKINTGMNRLGIKPEDFLNTFKSIHQNRNIKIISIYSHFANADDLSHHLNNKQIKLFSDIYKRLKPSHPEIMFHMANSGGLINFPESHFDCVRCGCLIYGHYPNSLMNRSIKVQSVFELKAKILQILTIESSESVGYGSTFSVSKKTNIASVAIGYADGYSRKLSNNSIMILNKKKVNVIGNISMDQTSIELPMNSHTKTGDIVTIYSDRYPDTKVSYIADKIGTLSYEVLTTLSARVKRIYNS